MFQDSPIHEIHHKYACVKGYTLNTGTAKAQTSLHIHKVSPEPSLFAQTIYGTWGSYRKTPKNSDTRKIGCNHPKLWTRRLWPKDANEIQTVDPDQTAPRTVWSGSTVCSDLSVQKLRIIKVHSKGKRFTSVATSMKLESKSLNSVNENS